jgi:polyvinyl alcohol dehydrogenase (cytochrome)
MRIGGRLLVGEGQKSGVYHAVDASTMKGEWKTLVGNPSFVGGIVGSTAFDGGHVYGPLTVGGYVFALDADVGTNSWFSPIGDGPHLSNPVAVANGVVYAVDFRGFLRAIDAATGAPLAAIPMWPSGNGSPTLSWGGVSIARGSVYTAVGITGLDDGLIIAFRPGQ